MIFCRKSHFFDRKFLILIENSVFWTEIPFFLMYIGFLLGSEENIGYGLDQIRSSVPWQVRLRSVTSTPSTLSSTPSGCDKYAFGVVKYAYESAIQGYDMSGLEVRVRHKSDSVKASILGFCGQGLCLDQNWPNTSRKIYRKGLHHEALRAQGRSWPQKPRSYS